MLYDPKKIKVYYTAGTFGHFIAYLLESHIKGKLLPVPLTELGNSHGYRTYGTIEECDITGDNAMKSYKETNHDHNSIGITWPAEMFAYCLHASIARTRTEDQKDGIRELENDAYTFLKTNVGEYWHLLSKDLETMYNFKISERNKRVPRSVLRQYYFFQFAMQNQNRLMILNERIKNNKALTKLPIAVILDYESLRDFLQTVTGNNLDFRNLHDDFVRLNRSLKMHHEIKQITDAVKSKENMSIKNLDCVTEAGIFYELEKYFYDIPFYNIPKFFKTTADIIMYVETFPTFMKQPNQLFQKKLHKTISRREHGWF